MRMALELAERGRGRVEPNPLVGAVVVRRGRVIGRGRHRTFGGPHAEVNAIRNAGGDVAGGTLYVTLEPCAHHGKTPPCTDLLIRAKVRRVVVPCRDPFPKVAGAGIRKLRAAGIRVDVGVLRGPARELNAPYLKRVRTGLPYVIAKWAMTLDGRIATRTGDSKWISSPEARRYAHELRGRVDAILVGIGTVLADDPRLTCRAPGGRSPARVVLDSAARLPLDSRLVRSARRTPVVVATSPQAPRRRLEPLAARGCQVVAFPTRRGKVSVVRVLEWLGAMQTTNVLVEGGAEVHGAFFDAGQVDEVLAFVGPQVLGAGRPAVLNAGVAKVAGAVRLGPFTVERLGDSVLLRGRVRPARTTSRRSTA